MCDRNVCGVPTEGRPSALQRMSRSLGLPRRQSFNVPQNTVSNYLRARQPAPVVHDPTPRYNEFFPPQQLQSSPVYGCHTHGICPGELNRTPSMVAGMEQTPSTFDRDIRDEDLADEFGVYEDMSHEQAYKDLWGHSFQSPQYEPLPRTPKRYRQKTTQEILEQCLQLAKYQSARRQILTDVATLSSPSDFQQPLGPGASTPEGSPAQAAALPNTIEGMSPIRGDESACPPCDDQ